MTNVEFPGLSGLRRDNRDTGRWDIGKVGKMLYPTSHFPARRLKLMQEVESMSEPTKKAGNGHRLRLDSKNRVSLPKDYVKNVSSFEVEFNERDGSVTLRPHAEIPLREHWLHANPVAKAQVLKGLEQMSRGEVEDLGSFAAYADADQEED